MSPACIGESAIEFRAQSGQASGTKSAGRNKKPLVWERTDRAYWINPAVMEGGKGKPLCGERDRCLQGV